MSEGGMYFTIPRRYFKRSILKQNQLNDAGFVETARSEYGLGIPLTPVQGVLLGMVDASRNYPERIFQSNDEVTHQLLKNLLGYGTDRQRLWLPPDARVKIKDGDLSIEFKSPITLMLCIAGRRSGKTTIASILMSILARRILKDPDFLDGIPILDDSQISLINVACDTHQAQIFFQMLVRNLHRLRLLPKKSNPTERMKIGRLKIESLSSSSRSGRGRTACGVCFDEFAHFQRTNGPFADRAVWTALTPSLATFGEKSLAVVATSPSGRSGVVWDLFEQRGMRAGTLTIQVPTWIMNPKIPREKLEEEFARDENLARQEYGAEFLAPYGRFLKLDDIQNCVVDEILPAPNDVGYHIHVDLGFKHDATAIALGFLDQNDGDKWRVVIERVEIYQAGPGEILNAGEIENRIITLAEGRKVMGISFDQHQSAYLIERLKSKGYNAIEFPATSKSNQEIYSFLRDLMTSGQIALPNNPRLIDELSMLEINITNWGFKVEAQSGGYDDAADAVAVCAWMVARNAGSGDSEWIDLFDIIQKREV